VSREINPWKSFDLLRDSNLWPLAPSAGCLTDRPPELTITINGVYSAAIYIVDYIDHHVYRVYSIFSICEDRRHAWTYLSQSLSWLWRHHWTSPSRNLWHKYIQPPSPQKNNNTQLLYVGRKKLGWLYTDITWTIFYWMRNPWGLHVTYSHVPYWKVSKFQLTGSAIHIPSRAYHRKDNQNLQRLFEFLFMALERLSSGYFWDAHLSLTP